MNHILPILIAFVDAAFGAYFAIVKSKRERLWLERYESLKAIVIAAESIRHESSLRALESLGANIMSDLDRVNLQNEVNANKTVIREKLSILRLLFKDEELSELVNSCQELTSAMINLLNMTPSESREDFHVEVENAATSVIMYSVSLSQRKCT